jgi:hypothetical protein
MQTTHPAHLILHLIALIILCERYWSGGLWIWHWILIQRVQSLVTGQIYAQILFFFFLLTNWNLHLSKINFWECKIYPPHTLEPTFSWRSLHQLSFLWSPSHLK